MPILNIFPMSKLTTLTWNLFHPLRQPQFGKHPAQVGSRHRCRPQDRICKETHKIRKFKIYRPMYRILIKSSNKRSNKLSRKKNMWNLLVPLSPRKLCSLRKFPILWISTCLRIEGLSPWHISFPQLIINWEDQSLQ